MDINDIFHVCEDDHELLAFLQATKLILDKKNCEICNLKCKIYQKKSKFFFFCIQCNKWYTCTPKGFFLNNVHLEYDMCLKIMFLFTTNVTVTQAQKILTVGEKSLIDWHNFCREVCFLEVTSNKEKIGGAGKHVEIDESVFGKRKYNKGRFIDGQWVIGGIERESGKFFYEAIPKRDSNTLVEVIIRNVEKDTTIITDEWRGYKGIEKHNYKHMTVNHSKTFVNPSTKEHTNTIESTWNKVSK